MSLLAQALIYVSLLASPALGSEAFSSRLASDLRDVKDRPVMKVVRLLQDMEAELQKSMDDDKAVHEMLDCWCKTNKKEKTAAIEAGEAKEAQLKAFIGETWATIQELQVKRQATRDEVYANQKSLDEATAMRMKENKEFQKEEVFLQEAIDASGQAIVVLGVHHPELAQLRSAARALQAANVMRLVPSSGGLRKEQLEALKDFLKQPEGSSSFLAVPGFKSYAPQSGQIFGILKQMKKDFENSLADAQANEKRAKDEYEMLKAAKMEEIAAGEKAVTQMSIDIATLTEKHAIAIQELEDTQFQLSLDRAFLADLLKKCAESEEEFQSRMKSRQEEIVAVGDTIAILNKDTAFDNMEKTVNDRRGLADTTVPQSFLQVGMSSQEKQQRMRVSDLLQKAADQSGAPQLALLAASVQLDSFTKVKEEIDKLVVQMTKQQEDEITQRDWCIDELNKNNLSTAAADHKKNNLLATIADLEKTIAGLTEDIEATKAAIAEMQEQMKRASEVREAGNADYQETITDQRMTQVILKKALDRMKEVYAFLQHENLAEPPQPGAAHIWTSGTHTDAGNGPARFTKYEQHAGGLRVVALLENIIGESRKMEDFAMSTEEDSQTAYETFMQDSNTVITAKLKAIAHMEEARAKAKMSLSMAKSDLAQTMQELENLFHMNGNLHKSCDYILDNFTARQAARAAEIAALQEAKSILSGEGLHATGTEMGL